ncbi:glycosyltransferase [Chromatium okenii]|jgi:glycosyltransferase involved in cell wall biosynthesis|uniref:Glycosyl transferase n=1 Tax=Chromatium okenii TaxID=61644 RepID=A0A2S7XTE7_9GAMM|nr:glycosyltransferase [Chromatium okenii]PQJ97014.1 glycosyl transferase [Chromatium okenii]
MNIAILISDFESGGVERSLTHLATGLTHCGFQVDYLVGNPTHSYLQNLDARVQVYSVTENRAASLSAYLRAQRPAILLTAKLTDDLLAVALRTQLQLNHLRLVTIVGTVLSASVAESSFNPLRNWLKRQRIRKTYQQLDAMVAVSHGVAEDLRQQFGLHTPPIRVLANPIISADLMTLATQPCVHPWLQPNAPPVVLAIGGLRRVKDFPTLLAAFAQLIQQVDARLIILGEGRQRAKLERLAARLGITAQLALPGFVANPFPWLARARVLALSSRREGFGNVLIEALALGTPVVATDCPTGPREALGNGRWGKLVPVGDAAALANALHDSLRDSAARRSQPEAIEPYRVEIASAAYALFLQELMRSERRN